MLHVCRRRSRAFALSLLLPACGDDAPAPAPTPPAQDTTLQVSSLGTHFSGQPIPFSIPEGATGFTLFANFPLHSGFETVSSPSNMALIQGASIPGTAALFRAAPTFSNTPEPYGVVAAVPLSDAPGALPLAAGQWQVTLRNQIGVAVQVPDVRLIVRTPGAQSGKTLDVNVFLSPAVIEQADMGEVISEAFAGFAGITLGAVRFFDLSGTASTIDGEEEFRALLNQTSAAGAAQGLDVLVVSDMSALMADGKAGWIPGLTLWHGTDVSGLAIEVSADREYMALRLRHEAGHVAGLLHTTEMDPGLGDALADTPICTSASMLESCPDAANLMFPIPNDIWSGALSAAQEQVIAASAFYRSGEAVAASSQALAATPAAPLRREGALGGLSGRSFAALASPCGASAERLGRVQLSAGDFPALEAIAVDPSLPRYARRRAQWLIASASRPAPDTSR